MYIILKRVSSHIPPISEYTPKFRAFQDTYPDSPYEIFITRIRALLVGLYLDSAYILVQSRIRLFQMVIYPLAPLSDLLPVFAVD